MVEIKMYKAFDGKIFDNREDCVAYEEENKGKQYEKLKELRLIIDEYCEMNSENCKNCIFEKYCGDMYTAIREEMKKFEDE